VVDDTGAMQINECVLYSIAKAWTILCILQSPL
jgi:hypothetical protein